jgi:hypothetical protein
MVGGGGGVFLGFLGMVMVDGCVCFFGGGVFVFFASFFSLGQWLRSRDNPTDPSDPTDFIFHAFASNGAIYLSS